MPVEQLKGSIKSNIKLRMYNSIYISQLGTCVVTIKFKNSKKHCVFFVVLGNGQVLLGMQDMASLSILNLKIDSVRHRWQTAEQTENRKHTKWGRTAQTQTELESSNKSPMVKTSQPN